MSINSCLSSRTQFILLLFPVPKSHIYESQQEQLGGGGIAYHVLVPEEEHKCHRVIQFIHLVEVFDLFQITDVNDSEVFDAVRDAIEDFILAHTVRVPVFAEANDYETFVFRHDGLVDVPTGDKVGEDY
jgi:hypothetical protein